MRSSRLLVPLFSLSALLVSACGGGGDGTTPPASITVSVSPGALTVAQGGSGSVDVTISRANFSGSVAVSAEGLPAGATATVTPAQLASTTTSAQVVVNAASTVATGTYTITVRGTAAGVSAQTTYALTIVAPPDFALTASPATASVSSTTTASSTISIARTGGFAGAVDFTLQSAQAGITGTFTPASSTGSSVSVVVSATGAVPLGTYSATVTGNGAGVGNRTTTISVTVVAPPDYTLAATPSSLTIIVGASGTTAVAVTRSGGFTGGVTLALQSAQAGITGVFTPAIATGASASLAVNVAASVPPGTYATTIAGTAAGVANRSTPLTVIVAETPRIALVAVPPTVSVAQGGSGSSTITLTRTNYLPAVTLTASGQPVGVTPVIEPHPSIPNTFVMTMNVGGAVLVGTYPITVTATGAGVANAVTTVTLTVTAAAPNAEFRYCAAGENLREGYGAPVWLAYQDGDGAWTRVLPTTAGGVVSFRFTLSAPIAAIATLTPIVVAIRQQPEDVALLATRMSNARRGVSTSASNMRSSFGRPSANYSSRIDYGTRAELIALGASGGCVSSVVKRNTGSFVGLNGASQYGAVWLGGTSGSAFISNPNYALDVLLQGNQSLLATRGNANSVFDQIYLRRDVDRPVNGVIPAIDFSDMTKSYTPLERMVTMNNGLGDLLNARAIFRLMPANQSVTLSNGPQSVATTRAYRTLPIGVRDAGEGDEILATATMTNMAAVSVNSELRSVYAVPLTQGSDVTLAFGARIVAPTVTAINGAALTRVRINGTLPADYGALTSVTINESAGVNQYAFVFSAAYRAAAGIGANYEFTFPDLTAVAGFLPESVLMRGLVYVSIFSDGTTGGSQTALTPGRVYRSVLRTVETQY